MSLMVAAAPALFAAHQALLRHLAARLFALGPRPGDGARIKLLNKLLAAVNLAAGYGDDARLLSLLQLRWPAAGPVAPDAAQSAP